MTLKLKYSVAVAGLALVCTVGLGTAQAANLLATETAADVAIFVPDANWASFTFTSSGESATGTGTYFANSTANGGALVGPRIRNRPGPLALGFRSRRPAGPTRGRRYPGISR